MTVVQRIQQSRGNLALCLERMTYGSQVRNALLGCNDPSEFLRPLLHAVKIFDQTRTQYALVGAVAAIYYGRARSTDEIDFLVSLPADSPTLPDFQPPIHIRSNLFALEIFSRARESDCGGSLVRIADPHDLIAMGLRYDRVADDYNISQIVRHTPIDDSIIQQRVTPEQFRRFLELKQRD